MKVVTNAALLVGLLVAVAALEILCAPHRLLGGRRC